MSNETKNQDMTEIQRIRKETCEQLYVELDTKVEDCAKAVGVSPKTVYRWIKAGKWNEKKEEFHNLEKLINLNLKKALNRGLKSYANDPTNKDLQSLVSLLKQFKEQNKPSRTYKDHVIRILDHTVDYFLEKGMEELADGYKSCVIDLAEYLLNRQ